MTFVDLDQAIMDEAIQIGLKFGVKVSKKDAKTIALIGLVRPVSQTLKGVMELLRSKTKENDKPPDSWSPQTDWSVTALIDIFTVILNSVLFHLIIWYTLIRHQKNGPILKLEFFNPFLMPVSEREGGGEIKRGEEGEKRRRNERARERKRREREGDKWRL